MKKTIVFVLVIALALTACDTDGGGKPEPVEEPKNQSATITGLFDNNASATVKGTLTDSEWNGVPDKIKAALNARFEEAGEAAKDTLKAEYTIKDVIIILEKNPLYANYSATLLGDTMCINFGILNNAEALKLALWNATRVLSGQNVPEQG
jgi:hypothetical protein